VVAGQISTAAGVEVQRGGVREQAGRATDQIWGSGEEGAHRMGLAAVEWIGGKPEWRSLVRLEW
jgi:hypothetical protein